MGAELVGAGPRRHERRAPPGQGLHGALELLAPQCEGVEDAWGAGAQPALDHPARLQGAQPVGQQVGGDAGQGGQQLAVAGRADQELAHHQQAPALTHQVEGPRQAAEVAVGPGHRTLPSPLTNTSTLY